MHSRLVVALDATVPLLVGAVILVGMALQGGRSTQPLPMALGAAAAAPLWARRRAPGWTLGACTAVVAVLFHLRAAAAAPAVLAPAAALYAYALGRGRRQQLLAAIAAVGVVVAADLAHPGRPTIVQTAGHAALVAIPLLAAEAMRTHRSYLSVLRERLVLTERTRAQEAEHRAEQERMRIARELHDVVAHTLTTINVQAAAAAERAAPGESRDALEAIEQASHDAIGELRAVLGVLRDRAGTRAPRAPVPGVEAIPDLVRRSGDAGLDVTLRSRGERPPRLSDAVSLAAYRIVQESLTNARRHGAGGPVIVQLGFGADGLSVTVDNERARVNGGADPVSDQAGPGGGVGIAGMRERAAAVGGHCVAEPTTGGFRVSAELPYERA